MTDNADTWCPLPWIHACVRPDNVLKPCCRFQVNHTSDLKVNLDSIQEHGSDAMNEPYWTQLRKDMLDGVKRKECSKCHVQEETKIDDRGSMRQFLSNRYSLVINKETATEKFDKVRYIEMSVDNICNLQCKMCDSKFSSKLQLRDKFLGNKTHKKLEPSFKKFDNIDLSELTYVKILGGEPFMSPNFVKFIDYISSRGNPANIFIEIATNGTKIPNKDVVKKLNRFRHLHLIVSLDSFNKSNDYQRFGSSYLETFKHVLEYEKIFKSKSIKFHCVVSVLTANSLANTFSIISDKHNYYMSVDFVRYPEHLSLLYAPPELVSWVVDSNKSHPKAHSLLSTFLKSNKYDSAIWNKFLENTKTLDKYYNTNLEDYNPELAAVLKGLTNGL